MNGTTKQRYISTSIWSDDWFDSLSEREKLVYFYLLTNERTNIAGVYPCTLKNIRLEIGLDREEIERIIGKFSAAGKAFYYEEYIIIPKWLKHQKISERNTVFIGVVKVLQNLPENIKKFISDRKYYDYDVSAILKGFTQKEMAPPENDTKNKGAPPQKEMAPPENDEFWAHDSDIDFDFDLDSDRQTDKDINLLIAPVDNFETDPLESACLSVGLKINQEESRDIQTEFQEHDLQADFLVFALSQIKQDPKIKNPTGLLRHMLFNLTDYPDYLKNYKDFRKEKARKERIEQKARAPTSCPACAGDMKYGGDACRCNQCGAFFQYDEATNSYLPESQIVF